MKFVDKVMHVTVAAIIVSLFMLMSAIVVDMPEYFINAVLLVLWLVALLCLMPR